MRSGIFRGSLTRRDKKIIFLMVLHFLYNQVTRTSPLRRKIRNSSLCGRTYCNELLCVENEIRFHETTRMNHACFHKLLRFLENHGLMSTKRLQSDEKLIIFLYMLTGKEYRNIAERFQHSLSTVSRTVHEVLDVFNECNEEFMVEPCEDTPPEIANNPRFKRYFKNCIGAVDGTLIPAFICADVAEQKKWRSRKGLLSQNVLVACNFDMTVSYVLAGWSGSAHDSKVLADALMKGFHIPHGRYYVGDAGYGLKEYLLSPYRGYMYHLKEWSSSHRAPTTRYELFNRRHAQLRNVIERVFGVVKKRFPILKYRMPSFEMRYQVNVVKCCFAIHNFIVKNMHRDHFFMLQDEDYDEHDDTIDETLPPKERCDAWRDAISESMWNYYTN